LDDEVSPHTSALTTQGSLVFQHVYNLSLPSSFSVHRIHPSIIDYYHVLLIHTSPLEKTFISFDSPGILSEWDAFLRILSPCNEGDTDRRVHIDILDIEEMDKIGSPIQVQMEESRSVSHVPSRASLISGAESSQTGASRTSRLKPGWVMRDQLAAEM